MKLPVYCCLCILVCLGVSKGEQDQCTDGSCWPLYYILGAPKAGSSSLWQIFANYYDNSSAKTHHHRRLSSSMSDRDHYILDGHRPQDPNRKQRQLIIVQSQRKKEEITLKGANENGRRRPKNLPGKNSSLPLKKTPPKKKGTHSKTSKELSKKPESPLSSLKVSPSQINDPDLANMLKKPSAKKNPSFAQPKENPKLKQKILLQGANEGKRPNKRMSKALPASPIAPAEKSSLTSKFDICTRKKEERFWADGHTFHQLEIGNMRDMRSYIKRYTFICGNAYLESTSLLTGCSFVCASICIH